jgi:hypothetical protein
MTSVDLRHRMIGHTVMRWKLRGLIAATTVAVLAFLYAVHGITIGSPRADPTKAATYVGSKICAGCHRAEADLWRTTLLAPISFAREAADLRAALDYAQRLAAIAPGDPNLTALIDNLRSQIEKSNPQ